MKNSNFDLYHDVTYNPDSNILQLTLSKYRSDFFDLSHKLPKDFKLGIQQSLKISKKSQNCFGMELSVQCTLQK